jgi:hypothetical protein
VTINSTVQTIAALGIVALAAGWLLWRLLGKRHDPGCGNEGCGAVSPDARALLKKIKKG